ncbi:MAG: hypothetical protein ACLGI3_03920 [Actinomycetes bacterium]
MATAALVLGGVAVALALVLLAVDPPPDPRDDQRKELQDQVRGRAPVVPERLGLARLQAEALLDQRATLVTQTGVMVSFVGLRIADRSLPRTLLTVAFITAIAVAAVRFRRDERLARRFLDAHPATGDESAA